MSPQVDNLGRSLPLLPSIKSGYPLPGTISVITPIARRNMVTNPSFETGTANWASDGGGSSISRITTDGFKGAACAAITNAGSGNGIILYGGTTALSLTSGSDYAFSFYARVRYVAPISLSPRLTMAVATTGNVIITSKSFNLTHEWKRYWMPYRETTTASRRLLLRQDATQAQFTQYCIDAVQFELCESGNVYPTTYIDGDQIGLIPNEYPAPYFWEGTAHASPSQRRATTRAGGRIVPLSTFGFTVTGLIGLGMVSVSNQLVPFAALDGGQYNRTRKDSRDFTIVGRFDADSYSLLQYNRGRLATLLDRDLVPQDQPVKLWYTPMNEDGRELGNPIELIGVYQNGLRGEWSDFNSEVVPIQFIAPVPGLPSIREEGAALSALQVSLNANGLIKRSASGVWGPVGGTGITPGASGVSVGFTTRPDGQIYVYGDFTSAGASGADYIAIYNPTTDTFSNIKADTTFNGPVARVLMHPNGSAIIGGHFTNADGGANNDSITSFDGGTTFSNMGTGNLMQIWDLAIDGFGRIYAGGTSATMGGVASTNGICYWNGTTWVAMGTGVNAALEEVHTICVAGSRIYIGGTFADAGGVANTTNIAFWDWSDAVPAWRSLYGTLGAPNSSVESIVLGSDGFIYIGGLFTAVAGITVDYLVRFDGVSFSAVGRFGDSFNSYVIKLDNLRDGGIAVSGDFLGINRTLTPTLVANLRNNTMSMGAPMQYSAGGGAALGVLESPDGTLYVSLNSTGNIEPEMATSITNTGSENVYPTFRITGPTSGVGFLGRLTNFTTGRFIEFGDVPNEQSFDLLVGEILILDFHPTRGSFRSNFRGDISSYILASSQESEFHLVPGVNILGSYVEDSTMTVAAYWPISHTTVDTGRGR